MLSKYLATALALLPQLPQPPQEPGRALGPPTGLVGGSTQPLLPPLGYSLDLAVAAFAPFADAQGQPRVQPVAAAGTADFDADGNLDAWMLAAPSANGAELSVQMARASSLGRYRTWTVLPAGGWLNGATFHARDYTTGERVLLVDPGRPQLYAAHYTYPFGGNPQAGVFNIDPAWTIGAGAFEVATRDDDGDSNDDIAVLRAIDSHTTEVRKLHMGVGAGYLSPEREAAITLPFPARRLRLFDLDGDGVTDAAVEVLGVGVLCLRDDGTRLVAVEFAPYPWPIADLICGDANRDGRDDFGIVGQSGIVLGLHTGLGNAPYYVALPAPSGIGGGFAAGALLGDQLGALAMVVGAAADGRSVAVFGSLGGANFLAPVVVRPATASALSGSTPLRPPLAVGDLDGDGDQDLLVPLPDGAQWMALRNGETSHQITNLAIVDRGSIGETGFEKFELSVALPPTAPQSGEVELAVFLEDPRPMVPRYVYWGRSLAPIDPITHSVVFTLFNQEDRLKLLQMLSLQNVNPYPGGLSIGGTGMLTMHFKVAGQRQQSLLLTYENEPDPTKSAIGVRWQLVAEPPKPSVDDDLMPWN